MTGTAFNARLSALAEVLSQDQLPPVEQWHPERESTIDMRIARDGSWYYRGSLIERQRMVRLFSTVLRCDEQGVTWLVTPHEKMRLEVEDAPFTAVLLDVQGEGPTQRFVFTTNVGDRVIAAASHPITVRYSEPDGEPSPYVLVRGHLQALISRSVFIELGGFAVSRDDRLGVVSSGHFMPLDDTGAAS